MTGDLSNIDFEKLVEWVGQQTAMHEDIPPQLIVSTYKTSAIRDVIAATLKAIDTNADLFLSLLPSTVSWRRENEQTVVDKLRVAYAREHLAEDGKIEVDADAPVSGSGDAGDYVMGWVWVADSDLDLEVGEAEYLVKDPDPKMLDKPLPVFLQHETLRALIVSGLGLQGHDVAKWQERVTMALIWLKLVPGAVHADEGILDRPSQQLLEYVQDKMVAYMKEPKYCSESNPDIFGQDPAIAETVSA